MNILAQIADRASVDPARIVLCEGEDPRILHAAVRAANTGIAIITVVGNQEAIQACASREGITLEKISIVDPERSQLTAVLADALFQRRKEKGLIMEQAAHDVRDPLRFANLMVQTRHADGCVAGAVYTTADVVRCALQIIGKDPDSALVSSFFLMLFDKPHHPIQGGMIFSDCALVIDPTALQLGDIAVAAAQSARNLLDTTPSVAMLSFSTAGSAQHPRVEKVIQAARAVKKRYPDMMIDEDIQLDTAIVPDIAARKLPASEVQGNANVLVFPDLDAGNIGYKLAERIGGATAVGPLLQGLNYPANDLSRGCSADDVYHVIAVTGIQARASQDNT